MSESRYSTYIQALFTVDFLPWANCIIIFVYTDCKFIGIYFFVVLCTAHILYIM